MISRRNVLKVIGSASMATAIGLNVGHRPVNAQSNETIGNVFVTKRGPVTLHTYVAPDASAQVTSHIIETANQLVIVDAQWFQSLGADFRAYADSIGKPIARVILSHEHPDHWFGATQFTDVPFITTATIAETAEANMETYRQILSSVAEPSEVPDTPNVPDGSLTGDAEEIDGIQFEYRIDNNAEAIEHLSIHLPQANIWIVQDLIYNNTHFFPGMDRQNWIATLETLATDLNQEDLLLSGHGLPTTKGEIDAAIAYLRLADELATDATDADAIVSALQEAYPAHGGMELLGFWPLFIQ